ncbi:acyl-CoA dehydratase activase [Chloroflexota bacterium]
MLYFAGVDIGSAFSKATIVAESKLISYHIIPSGGNYKLAADEVVRETLTKASLSFGDIAYTVATGYGGSNASFSNQLITDISCQSRGIFHLFPSVRTVVDIGGQFSRVIKLDDSGRATAFLLSEKCASGSGRFLQIIAHVLQIDLKEIGPLSLKSKKKINFNTGCAVFAETEAVSRVAEGTATEDILAGVHGALAAKIQNLLERLGIEQDLALVGGGAKDIGLVRSIGETLGINPVVPEEPQIVAALGAALIAEEKAFPVGVSKQSGN